MGGRLVITDRTDGIVTAHWGPLYLPLFLDSASMASLSVMDREEGALLRRHPDGITVITLVPELPLAAMPSDVRAKVAEMFGRYAPSLRGAATVIAGSGFFPSLIRSIVSGAALASRSRVPQKSFSRIDDAIDWAAELPGQPASVASERAEIVDALNRMAFEHGVELG